MPGTPAFTQTRTASITLGTFPPREFRSVATLLTLTESLIMNRPDASSAQMHLQGLHDFCGHCLYFTAAIAGEQILRENQMPRLLAAEREMLLLHFLHHVLVANAGAPQADVFVLQTELETDVAHHGGHHGIAAQPPFGLHLLGAHEHDVI